MKTKSTKTKQSNILIAPSILAANLGYLASEIASIEEAGADWIHIDVMDGTFVPPITFGDNVVKVAKQNCSLPLDVHLMIVEPDKHIKTFASAGANRITVHQEICPNLHRTLGSIKDAGCSAGVVINPGTPVETIYEVLDLVDLVLIMTVNPGWGGQKFISSCLEKIKRVKSEIDNRSLDIHLQVDGGVNKDTAHQCILAGANVLVAGTAVFGEKNRKLAIAALKK